MSSIVKPFADAVAVKRTRGNNVFIPSMAAYYHGMSGLRSARLAAVVVAIVAACGGGQKTVRRPGEEYLAEIRIETTTKAFNPKNIIPGLQLNRVKGKRALDEYQLSLDVTRIEGTFQKYGYFAAKVTPRVERKGLQQIVIFHVDEGPRATATVDIIGLPPDVDPKKARELVDIKDGDPFTYDAFDAAKTPMLALVENAGYAKVVMQAAVIADKAANTAVLQYAFDPGPRSTFGTVDIVGVTGPLAEAARARVTFKPGDGYSTKALAETQEAISGIGMFSSVRVDADRSSSDAVVPVRVQLTEALHWEARGGIGFGIDQLSYNFRLRGSLSHTGWPTPLSTLSLEARPALVILRESCGVLDLLQLDCTAPPEQPLVEPRIHVLGSAVQQDFIRTGVKAEVDGGYDYITLEGYLEQGPLAQVGLDSALGWSRLHGHIGWKFANYTFSNLSVALAPDPEAVAGDPMPLNPMKAVELGLDHPERLGAFTQSVELDLRDNPVEPTSGAYALVKLAEGTIAAGGAYDYFQVTPEVRGYAHLGGTVFAARARYGTIFGDVPPTERYYAGGASSQRGFSDRHLSPEAEAVTVDAMGNLTTTDKVVIGGASLFETGIEVRRHFEPFGIKAGGVVFLDGGDVAESPEFLHLDNLHWAVGAGVRRYYLPIGPIRFELARRLNRTKPTDPSYGENWNFILSVGEAF
jgi:outer membrane protein assembly factor BamA